MTPIKDKGNIDEFTEPIKFIDLFCGIGGFRFAIQSVAKQNNYKPICVLSSDIDVLL